MSFAKIIIPNTCQTFFAGFAIVVNFTKTLFHKYYPNNKISKNEITVINKLPTSSAKG